MIIIHAIINMMRTEMVITNPSGKLVFRLTSSSPPACNSLVGRYSGSSLASSSAFFLRDLNISVGPIIPFRNQHYIRNNKSSERDIKKHRHRLK